VPGAVVPTKALWCRLRAVARGGRISGARRERVARHMSVLAEGSSRRCTGKQTTGRVPEQEVEELWKSTHHL
jgi:hypothetical protein